MMMSFSFSFRNDNRDDLGSEEEDEILGAPYLNALPLTSILFW